MPSELLDIINQLDKAIHSQEANEAERLFEIIQEDLDRDPNTTDFERDDLSRINSNLGLQLLGKPCVKVGPALYGLENSLIKRTIGLDGYPLKS